MKELRYGSSIISVRSDEDRVLDLKTPCECFNTLLATTCRLMAVVPIQEDVRSPSLW